MEVAGWILSTALEVQAPAEQRDDVIGGMWRNVDDCVPSAAYRRTKLGLSTHFHFYYLLGYVCMYGGIFPAHLLHHRVEGSGVRV